MNAAVLALQQLQRAEGACDKLAELQVHRQRFQKAAFRIQALQRVVKRIGVSLEGKCTHDDGFREYIDTSGKSWQCCDMCGFRRVAVLTDQPGSEGKRNQPGSKDACNHEDGLREVVDALGKVDLRCDTCTIVLFAHSEEVN